MEPPAKRVKTIWPEYVKDPFDMMMPEYDDWVLCDSEDSQVLIPPVSASGSGSSSSNSAGDHHLQPAVEGGEVAGGDGLDSGIAAHDPESGCPEEA